MPQPSFDVVFHLIGGQALPNAFAIHAVPAEHHILFVTDKTEGIAKRLQNAFADKRLEAIPVEPYNIPGLQAIFTDQLHRFAGQRMAANITGATKPMALMLAHVAAQIGQIPLYYMETSPDPLKIEIWPNADKWTASTSFLETAIKTVREYIALHSDALFEPGEKTCDAHAIALARTIAACPSIRKSLSFKLSKFVDCLPNAKYDFYESQFDATLDDFDRDLAKKHTWDTKARNACRAGIQAMIETDGKEATCRFLGGIWLEIFAFSELQGRDGFFDVQQSAHVKFRQNEYDRQEFDVATCTKHHVYIVECKSGRVTSEQIADLTANVTQYAGTFGRGVLLTSSECMGHTSDREAYENLKTRIRESGNIMLVELPKKLPPNFLANALRSWKEGVYTPPAQGFPPKRR